MNSTACLAPAPADQATATDRIARLREQIMSRRGSFVDGLNPYVCDAALYRALRPGIAMMELRAEYLFRLVECAPLALPPLWTLAGEHLSNGRGFPNACAFAQKTPPPGAATQFAALGLEDPAAVEAAVRGFLDARHKTPRGAVGEAGELTGMGFWSESTAITQIVAHAGGWSENHSVRDYPKLLRLGFAGLRREVEARMSTMRCDDPAFAAAEKAWRSWLRVCDAGVLLGHRYAEAAAAAARGAGDEAERERLSAMAERCRRVPEHGATTLAEAVQTLWLGHILTCGEDGINANSIGRLDVMLEPYYQADVAAGRIDRAGAVELMGELACKLYLEYDVQAITLGGLDGDGKDACGAMTGIILEATQGAGFIRQVLIRVHSQTPTEVLTRAARIIQGGGGIPYFFNDECFVPALAERGIALTEARDYAVIGCVELTIPGKTSPHAVSGIFNLTKCVELALFDGIEPHSGRRLGPATGALASFVSFADLLAAVQRQVEHFAARMVYHCNRGELLQREGGPLPFLSLLTDDCIARGRDLGDGGARYQYHSIALLGVPDAADALWAVKELLYERRTTTADELLAALKNDWTGHEALRRTVLERCDKFGNDCAGVDELAGELAGRFIDLMDLARSPLGARYVVHLFSFLWNVSDGKSVGSLPDGRMAGEPLAYSVSAHQGRDRHGITALLRSVARIPHRRAAGASAAMIDVDPKVVQGEAGVRLLVSLIRAGVTLGVGQMQWNVCNAERLRQAQEDPDRYGNVEVRVAGYSQQFRLLGRDLQNHVIARTKHEG